MPYGSCVDDTLHLHGTSVTLYQRTPTSQHVASRRRSFYKFDRQYFPKPLVHHHHRPVVVREQIPVHIARIPSECQSVGKRTGRCCQNRGASCRVENLALRRIRRAQDETEFKELFALYKRQIQDSPRSRYEYERCLYEDLYKDLYSRRDFVQERDQHMSAAVEELTKDLRRARLTDDQDGGTPLITISDYTSSSSSANSACGFSENSSEGANTARLTVPSVSSACESRPP